MTKKFKEGESSDQGKKEDLKRRRKIKRVLHCKSAVGGSNKLYVPGGINCKIKVEM